MVEFIWFIIGIAFAFLLVSLGIAIIKASWEGYF